MSPDSHRAAAAAAVTEQAAAANFEESTLAWRDSTDEVRVFSNEESLEGARDASSLAADQDHTTKISLSDAINRATRSLHTDLNSAIVQAMPHGLPPEAEKPNLYAHGLAVFVGTVYQTFEAEWAHLRHETLASSFSDDKQTVDEQKNHRKRLHTYLAHLLPAGIERTSRIRRDLEYFGIDPARRPPPNTVEARYETHIRTVTRAKPHLLLAYSWCMYMAIFAGGRYVRQALSDVPDSFWESGHANKQQPKPAPNPFFEDDYEEVTQGPSSQSTGQSDRPAYSFLSFDGDDDGVSIAQAFRAGFAKADKILTKHERQEVIEESQTVFEYCIALVKELNDDTSNGTAETTYEEAERIVDQEKRAVMQALEMGDEEGQIPRSVPVRRSRIFLLKAVTFGLLWTLFFGKVVTWLTDKTPQREQA